MPPTSRGHANSFLALFVEDEMARVWNVEMASGATDEIARFSTDGMNRTQILEIARQFARARRPARESSIGALIEAASEPQPAKRAGRPRKAEPKRARTTYDPEGRIKQIARQSELYEALLSFGEGGATSHELAEKLGRSVTAVAVPCGALVRAGKAIRIDGKWFAIENGKNEA